MEVTIEMAASINGLIATEEGSEDFLSDRNYQIMLDFLKEQDCLVYGNTTFKNVISWGEDYINALKDTTVIIYSIGVWAVSQSQCGRSVSQLGYASSPW